MTNECNCSSNWGKIGGSYKTPAKAAAARENGKLGGRPLNMNLDLIKKESVRRLKFDLKLVELFCNHPKGYLKNYWCPVNIKIEKLTSNTITFGLDDMDPFAKHATINLSVYELLGVPWNDEEKTSL